MPPNRRGRTVLFVGDIGGRFPLEPTQRKKYEYLSGIGDVWAVGPADGVKETHQWAESGCRFVGVPDSSSRVRKNLRLFWQVARLVRRMQRDSSPLVVICQSYVHAVVPLLLRRRARCWVVAEVHGEWLESYFLYHPEVRAQRIKKWILGRLGRWVFRRADAVRVVSEATRRTLPVVPRRLYQFPAFTDLDLFFEAGKRFSDQRNLQDVLFAGSLVRLKGVADLLEAFKVVAKRFPKARLLLAGEGPDAELFRQLAAPLGERVVFLGHLSQRDLAERMARSGCLVLPSYTEGLGRVLIEGMAARLPLIGTRVGGIPEVIEPEVNGLLVPPGNPVALADALELLLSNPVAAQRMGESGHQRARILFSPDRYVQSYKRMIDEIIEERPSFDVCKLSEKKKG